MVNGEAGVNVPVPEVVSKPMVKALLASTGLPKASSKATVIVVEATPVVRVCGAVVKARRLAAAGLIVSCCVADARPPAVAVSVGVPTESSVYWKLTLPTPDGIVSGESGEKEPLLDDVLRLTVTAPVAATGFPNESFRAMVIVPEAVPAVRVCGAVVNVKCVAAAGLTVSCCVAEVRLPVAAVSVGVPAVESLYWKLTVPAASGNRQG